MHVIYVAYVTVAAPALIASCGKLTLKEGSNTYSAPFAYGLTPYEFRASTGL